MPAVGVMSYSLKGFNHITATPKHEMDMHAEVPVPAGGDHILKGKKSVVTKKGMKYIPGFLIARNG